MSAEDTTPTPSTDPFAEVRGELPEEAPADEPEVDDAPANATVAFATTPNGHDAEQEPADDESSRSRRAAQAAAIAERVMDLSPSTDVDLATLDRIERRLSMCSYSSTVISFNGETVDPARAAGARGEALAALEELRVETLCGGELGTVLKRLAGKQDELAPDRNAQVRVLSRDRREALAVPAERLADFTRLTCEATSVWHQAKVNNDWAAFEPYLDRIVSELRDQAQYLDPSRAPYDVWLDQYERGTSMAFYDGLFERLRSAIVPLVNAIRDTNWQPNDRYVHGRFDHDRQMVLAHELMAVEGVPADSLVIAETEHPFSDGVSCTHAFIATHIYEYDVLSNIYSMLHEGGHALYELGVNPAFEQTSLRGGTSMGIHESQSRFFENIVGRSVPFMHPLIMAMSKAFPGRFNAMSQRELYQLVNRVEPSLIRTEADELTYPLHIMVRYEIEKALFEGRAKAKDVPLLWGRLYRQYLGVTVPDHSRGALQDTHWAGGALGYFPTYALGSAYSAQFLAAMIRDGVDFENACRSGRLAPIHQWLRKNIWSHGRSLDAPEIIEGACGEPFDPEYYISYLETKFRAIYRV